MRTALFDTLKTASAMTDSVIVGFSGGKDSAVTLDLCFRYFKHVHPYFMYIVKGLSFQERMLRYYEDRYKTEIMRIPHFMLAEFFRYGTFCNPDPSVPIVGVAEMYDWLREQTGAYWIAAGERINDSIWRRAMIKKSGTIDAKRGRVYPIAFWTKAEVMGYLKNKRLPLSLEYDSLGFSFRSLSAEEIRVIRERFPADFERIRTWFPLVEAGLKYDEFYRGFDDGGVQVSEV